MRGWMVIAEYSDEIQHELDVLDDRKDRLLERFYEFSPEPLLSCPVILNGTPKVLSPRGPIDISRYCPGTVSFREGGFGYLNRVVYCPQRQEGMAAFSLFHEIGHIGGGKIRPLEISLPPEFLVTAEEYAHTGASELRAWSGAEDVVDRLASDGYPFREWLGEENMRLERTLSLASYETLYCASLLEDAYLSGSPLREFPPLVMVQGSESICAYLRGDALLEDVIIRAAS